MGFGYKIKGMRKLFLYVFLGLILCNTGFAEKYNCSYLFDGEEFSLKLEKISDYSYSFKMHYEAEEYILGETEKLLILGAPRYVDDPNLNIEDVSVFRVIFLDKIDKTFTMTNVIEPSLSQHYSNGIWGYTKGTCE